MWAFKENERILMAIVTHPANDEYRKGFDETWGRRCLLCRKPIDRKHEAEWAAEVHEACEQGRNGET